MTAFEGARIAFCHDMWAADGAVGLTVTVRGRTAGGRWLTGADAQCSLAGLEDIEMLAENCGCLFVSMDGMDEAADLLVAAFPGADVRCYEDDEEPEPELGVTGAAPLHTFEITWEGCESCGTA